MKSETKPNGSKRFGYSGKTISEYFRVFREVVASARDEKLKPLYPREWDLAYIGLPKVNKRQQHRMSARYARQLPEDVKYRKEWAEKVGLGFELPQASKPESQASESPADVNCATCATNSQRQECIAAA
jgi:hypothetical protein